MLMFDLKSEIRFPTVIFLGQTLSTTASTDYSLYIPSSSPPLRTPQGSWARTNITKAEVFANHLTSVFQPHPSKNSPRVDESLTSLLESPYQLELPPHRFKYSEIQTVINNLSPKLPQATTSSQVRSSKSYPLMESRSNYPPFETRQTSQRSLILPPYKSPSHALKSF
jgi:hypothetical protein